jgi:hypothetical protein
MASTAPKIFLQWPVTTIEQQSETTENTGLRELNDGTGHEEIELEFTAQEPIAEASPLPIQKLFC